MNLNVENTKAQMRKGVLEYCILSLLSGEDLYPGVDPAMYGLDSDKPILASDGSRGWVVDAHYLAMIFGADWRRVVYGN